MLERLTDYLQTAAQYDLILILGLSLTDLAGGTNDLLTGDESNITAALEVRLDLA